jgi:hypothetical protein
MKTRALQFFFFFWGGRQKDREFQGIYTAREEEDVDNENVRTMGKTEEWRKAVRSCKASNISRWSLYQPRTSRVCYLPVALNYHSLLSNVDTSM